MSDGKQMLDRMATVPATDRVLADATTVAAIAARPSNADRDEAVIATVWGRLEVSIREPLPYVPVFRRTRPPLDTAVIEGSANLPELFGTPRRFRDRRDGDVP